MFDKVDWVGAGKSEDDFVDELKRKDAPFVRRLSGFLDGEVTLENGSEHKLLQSISDQVTEELKYPTERQIDAFKGIFDSLTDIKRAGNPLREETEEDREKRSRAAEKLLKIGNKNLHMFNEKTKKIISDMTIRFEERKNLSVKTIDYLRMIVEKLPMEKLEE